MHYILPILGIAVFLFIAWLMSENRKHIVWRPVLLGMAMVFVFGWALLGTKFGNTVKEAGGNGITAFIQCADEGAKAIFNEKLISGASELCCAGLTFLPSLIFIGSLSAALYYLGILQFVIRVFAVLVTKVTRISGAEALISVANMFLGMVESPFTVKPYLPRFTRSQLFCMMTCGMASIAGGVMVVYGGMLQKAGTSPGHLIIASILTVFSAIVISKIIVPETDPETANSFAETSQKEQNGSDANLLDAICRGGSEGMALAINVMAMLIAFGALMALMNLLLGLFGTVGDAPLTVQRFFGWLFAPFAYLMGVPWNECHFAGQLLGEKTILNEFIAYLDMTNPDNLSQLSERSRVIMSYALCGFANFGSLAIMIGGLGSLVPTRRAEIAKLAIPSLVSGTLAAFITACLAALFV